MGKTVLVTGAGGYVARHIVRELLVAGHLVRGTLRRPADEEVVRASLAGVVEVAKDPVRFATVTADLTSDDGWDPAMKGIDVVMHIAHPLPWKPTRHPNELVAIGVGGVERVLGAAARAGVGDIVVTSSADAVTQDGGQGTRYDESDWTDPERPGLSANTVAKTRAERRAWEVSEREGLRLAVINPGVALGPPIGRDFGASVEMIARMMRGWPPMLPRIGSLCCDVRDVALAHLRAFEREDAWGHRYLVAEDFLWASDVAEEVRTAVPDVRVARREAPNILTRAYALFEPSYRQGVQNLERDYDADTTRLREVLGITPRSCRAAVRETALWLRSEGKA